MPTLERDRRQTQVAEDVSSTALLCSEHHQQLTFICRIPGSYDKREARKWRHLNLGPSRIWPLGAAASWSTSNCLGISRRLVQLGLEETTAYRPGRRRDVGNEDYGDRPGDRGTIVDRIVGERLDGSRFEGLPFIGIDEFSYRKRHRYITAVVDHVTGRIVWAAKGEKQRDARSSRPGDHHLTRLVVKSIQWLPIMVKKEPRMVRATTPVVNIAAAKARLPELIERASRGEEIILARAGRPRARLMPLASDRKGLRVPGKGKGRFRLRSGFDDELSEDVLALFYGPPA